MSTTRARAAILSVLTASALTLAGCSEAEEGGAADSADSADSAAPAEGTEPGPEVEYEEGEFPDAPADFKPVKNGSKLKFGNKADIVISDNEQNPIYIRVVAQEAQDLSVKDVEKNVGQKLEDREDYEGFRCMPYTIEYLGGPGAKDENTYKSGPVDSDGRDAPKIILQTHELCGVDEENSEKLISFDNAEPGTVYQNVVMTYDGKDGPMGTGLVVGDNAGAYKGDTMEIFFY